MRGKTNTITINGRTYDAATGKPIVPTAHKSSSHPAPGHVIKPSAPARTLKPAARSTQPVAPRKIAVVDSDHAPAPTTTAIKPGHKATHTAGAASAKQGRHTERSTTLMRHVVKKPVTGHKAKAVSGTTHQPGRVVIHNGAVANDGEQGKTYTKSEHISKFGPAHSVAKVSAHVPVAQAPAGHGAHKYDIANTPPTPIATQIVIPDNKPLKEIHRDLFETAIQNSTSHTAKKHPIHRAHAGRRKAARLTVAAASLLLLVGFFAYQNAPNLALKRASSTIGFTASVPGYRPSGFRTDGGVQYSPGKVTINFRSNSDDRTYSVSQVASGMTDQTLRSRFLTGQSYETIQSGDQTGYLYGNANYTWLRNGIWYNIEGNSGLSKDQLLHIASSLL